MTTRGGGRARWRRAAVPAALAAALVAVLSVPCPEPPVPPAGGRTPFAWRQDERWQAIEAAFRDARATGCRSLAPRIGAEFAAGDRLLAAAAGRPLEPDAPVLGEIERTAFDLGPMVAACPDRIPEYVGFATALRSVVKDQSRRWDMNSPATRDRLYRLLYGSRAAVEEAMLQAPAGAVPALTRCGDEPSATPAAEVLGVRIHSGDILLSRGGAPTSALIARGNDYPGNFSHVALVYVDARSGQASVVEAHIERGVAVSSLSDYLRDVKLRVMVLRARADLPGLAADPMLPHEAAAAAWRAAGRRHIPYDFAMDFHDHSRLFCSEVASAAYANAGVTLWMGLSHISSPGLAAWLAGFGVRRFETQEPSDLEYDPQLRVVAEWRDPQTLFLDHVDNAVVDAMLEGAEAGESLRYPIAWLPVARLGKAYSWFLNRMGAVGPVPEGLSAAGALRNREFTRTHAAIRARVLLLAAEFARRNGYRAPYWELVVLARAARAQAGEGRG
ncbi:MAG: YiiX/YebB-like N1pC/P60 family cysteine hydrolase [Thermoanaerobaculaceae bacterium]|nr:YiiX/YebB-like N1pC/P60 family cysteine hydrolase [Thermoanaerobaculaceae bacterium]